MAAVEHSNLARLVGLGDKAATIAAEVAALSLAEQKALAVPTDAATRDKQLTAEISAVAEGEIALRAAERALAEKQLALDEKSEAVGQAMAKSLQYVLGIMIILATVQLQDGTRSWYVRWCWRAPRVVSLRAARLLGRASGDAGLAKPGCSRTCARSHSFAPPTRRARRTGEAPSTRPCRRSRSLWGYSSMPSCPAGAS